MAWSDYKKSSLSKEQYPNSFDKVIKDNKTVVDPYLQGIQERWPAQQTVEVTSDNWFAVTLTIPFKDKWPKTVQAKQIGDLAIINYDEDFDWCIVHVPTLTRFDKAIPDGDWSEEQLLLWAWKVQQATGPNWTALRSYTNDNYVDADPNLLQSILDYCLNIEVV